MRQLLIRDSVKQTLKQWKEDEIASTNTQKSLHMDISVVGWLIGVADLETVEVWHFVRNSPFTNSNDLQHIDRVLLKDIGFYASALPGPHIQLLGPIYVSHRQSKRGVVAEFLSTSLDKALSMFSIETYSMYDLKNESFYIKDSSSSLWETIDSTALVESCMQRDWYCFYTQLKLPCLFSGARRVDYCSASDCSGLWETLESRMEFLSVEKTDFKLLRQNEELKCELLAHSIGLSPIAQLNVADVRELERHIQVVPILCRYSLVSKENAVQGITVSYEKVEKVERIPFSLQVCCLLHSQDGVDVLIESLKHQLCNQFKYLTIVLEELPLEWKIFKPTSLLFPVMGLLPCNSQNELKNHEEMRRKHHEAFHVDKLFPYFRLAVALFSWKEQRERIDTSHLLDVHKKLIKKKSKSSQHEIQRIVRGSYQYFHYMQDGIQDKGWGCAYRSLQTIISWFRLQGYTSQNIPTHQQIQEILVEMGDKETTFIGSKQWIGATEVCYVLQHYLGVESKILFISSGAHVDNYARQIIQHFEQESTPVMIGGGVLAYTLLGIEYNESTGKVQYLILDPHYIGEDHMEVIIHKNKWCGWKDSNIFLKDAFYNLCMPMRPKNVV
ncbi:Probable Ufm1-specific protease [Galdieria sulphuraria]|nr:Probable Ufm1-specific protease [Galdieria sulphuraria]